MKDMFVIAGATGKTGRAAAEALLAEGKAVRVVARDGMKAARLHAQGAEVAVADLGDEAGLARALEGAVGAYLLLPDGPPDADRRRTADAMAAAVRRAGVDHVVFL